jgi:hypothetical protein
MSPFFPFFAAHDAFWSVITRGPVGLVGQFFLDPQLTIANPTADERLQMEPQGVLHEPLSFFCDKSNGQIPMGGVPVEPFAHEEGGPQWLRSSFQHEDVTLHFKVYVPSGNNGQSRPLIVMLHGAQQDADDFAVGTEMNAIAEAKGYIVIYPEQSESANPLKCWNWFRPADRRLESGETAMVAALTRKSIAMYNVDDARVYVGGRRDGRQPRSNTSGPFCGCCDPFGRGLRCCGRIPFRTLCDE